MKAPIYKDKDFVPSSGLLKDLRLAVDELEFQMKATKTIFKGTCPCGFGVDKIKRGIAADAVTAIARGIKSQKGW